MSKSSPDARLRRERRRADVREYRLVEINKWDAQKHEAIIAGQLELALSYLFAIEALESVYNSYQEGAFDES